jgi:hypothetical protein
MSRHKCERTFRVFHVCEAVPHTRTRMGVCVCLRGDKVDSLLARTVALNVTMPCHAVHGLCMALNCPRR